MSSWNPTSKLYAKTTQIPDLFHDITKSPNIYTLLLELLGAYIYSNSQNLSCIVYDPNGTLKKIIIFNPILKFVTTRPDNTNEITGSDILCAINSIKPQQVKAYAEALFRYTQGLTFFISQILQKASIRLGATDISLHIYHVSQINKYVHEIRDYQKKTEAKKISVYLMAETADNITQFKRAADPSWTVLNINKLDINDDSELFITNLAEVEILATSKAVILDYTNPIDRLVFIKRRNKMDESFVKEVDNKPWFLV